MFNLDFSNLGFLEISIVFFSLFTLLILEIPILSIFIIICVLIYNPRLFIFFLLILPSVETTAVIYSGVTISKILFLFSIIYFTISVLGFRVRNLAIKKLNYLIIIFFALIVGSFIAISNEPTLTNQILNEIWISNFPKVILFFLIINFYLKKGSKFFYESFNYLLLNLTLFLPLLYYNFSTNFEDYNWFNLTTRKYFAGSDPNELTIILSSYLPFLIFLFYFHKNYIIKLGAILSSLLIFSITLQTASRAGFLTFTLALLICILAFQKSENRLFLFFKSLLGLVITFAFISLALTFFPQLFDVSVIQSRFFDSLQYRALNITAGRTDFWISSITAFFNKPIFGYGPSILLSMKFNLENIGVYNVFHNTIIQTLFQFGLFGLVLYGFFITTLFKKSISLIKNIYFSPIAVSFLLIFIGSMSLSWLWREIFWILASLILVAYNFKFLKSENTSGNTLLG